MPSAAATNHTANATSTSATSLVKSLVQKVTLELPLTRPLVVKLLDAVTLKQQPPQQQLHQSHTLPLLTLLHSTPSLQSLKSRSALTRKVKNENTVNAGITLMLHAWSSFATELTMSEPPSETAVTKSQHVVLTKSLSPIRSMSAVHHTIAAHKPVSTFNVTKPSQNATTVKNWSPHTMMNAVALTPASASQASVLNSETVHVQKDMNELSATPMPAAQLPDASHVTQLQLRPLLVRPQHHTLPRLHHTRHQHQRLHHQ